MKVLDSAALRTALHIILSYFDILTKLYIQNEYLQLLLENELYYNNEFTSSCTM